MKNIIYNVEAGETMVEEVADIEMPIIMETPQPTESERITALETTSSAVVDVLAGALGVTI